MELERSEGPTGYRRGWGSVMQRSQRSTEAVREDPDRLLKQRKRAEQKQVHHINEPIQEYDIVQNIPSMTSPNFGIFSKICQPSKQVLRIFYVSDMRKRIIEQPTTTALRDLRAESVTSSMHSASQHVS